jgi:hypothetical protein
MKLWRRGVVAHLVAPALVTRSELRRANLRQQKNGRQTNGD